jgi:hypothetical protein
MTSDYSIIDWAYSKLDTSDLTSKEDVQAKIDEWATTNARDGGKSWEAFKNVVPDWFSKSSKGGVVIQDEVDETNKIDVANEIASANTPEQIDKIDSSVFYSDDVKSEIDKMIEQKKDEIEVPIIVDIGGEDFEIPVRFQRGRPREEVRDVVAALAGEAFEGIVTAETPEEVDAVELPLNIPKKVRAFLRSEKKIAKKEMST